MSRRYLYFLVVFALIVASLLAAMYVLRLGQPSIDPTTLTYYTEQFPPYNYKENGIVKGIAVDILGEITEKIGKRVTPNQVHLVSWTEGYQITLTTNNTVLFSTARLSEREQDFKWVGPVNTDSYVLFALRNRTIAINDPVELKGYRIGVITDDVSILQLFDAGVNSSQLVYDTNATVLAEKLFHGDIDLWCYPEIVGKYVVQQMTKDYDPFEVVFTLESVNSYYAFNKNIPDSTVKAFQQALDELKQEKDAAGISTYDRILEKYIP